MDIQILIANSSHLSYAEEICLQYEESAKVRGTGIAKRSPEYIKKKMMDEDAMIALNGDHLAGFCYIETFEDKKYVSNSGLIILPEYRRMGIARNLKKQVFNYARDRYPFARVFGITTSLAVMRINTELGYHPVTFSELTKDKTFWKGCRSCSNYAILQNKEFEMCLCTGMLAPSKEESMKVDLSHLIVTEVKS